MPSPLIEELLSECRNIKHGAMGTSLVAMAPVNRFSIHMPAKTQRRSYAKAKKTPACPECASIAVIPVVHGIPTTSMQKAIDQGKAILSNREEWEGMTEWYCKACGCDWSARWRRFKRLGSVNATR
jgi:hypothetical protein